MIHRICSVCVCVYVGVHVRVGVCACAYGCGLVLHSQTLFSHRGVIAFNISAPLEKGSGIVHRVYSVFTLMNVLIIRRSLWPRALKRWFFMLRDEIEFGKAVTWISLHLFKQKQRYQVLGLKAVLVSFIYIING